MDDVTALLQRGAGEPTRGPDIERAVRTARRRRIASAAVGALCVVAAAGTVAAVAAQREPGDGVHAGPPTTDVPTTSGVSTSTSVPTMTAVPSVAPVEYHDAAGRFSVAIRPGWYRSDGPLAWWLHSPHELLSLATEPGLAAPHAAPNEAACPSEIPKVAVDAIGATGAYIWLGEHRANESTHGGTPRPASFATADWQPLCSLPDGMSAFGFDFVDAGRAFTVSVVLGADVTAAHRDGVYRMLDSLVFEP